PEEDAVLTFKNDGKNWTSEEIEQVDKAFAIVHNETGNTRLLKRKDGVELTFWRDGRSDFAGSNSNREPGRIRLGDGALKATETFLVGTVIHEIGHNWDNENDNWDGFLRLSGWT